MSAAILLTGCSFLEKPVLRIAAFGDIQAINSPSHWGLINTGKVRGRKASIEALAEKMSQLARPGENKKVFICHGDCLEDALKLEQMLKEKCGIEEAFIGYTGAVIGSHSGPGTLALFFLGEKR